MFKADNNQKRDRKNKSIAVNKDMLIVHKKKVLGMLQGC